MGVLEVLADRGGRLIPGSTNFLTVKSKTGQLDKRFEDPLGFAPFLSRDLNPIGQLPLEAPLGLELIEDALDLAGHCGIAPEVPHALPA